MAAGQVENYHPKSFVYQSFDVLDNKDANIRKTFNAAINFIKRCRELNARVLVHCIAGVSRSSSVVIAYLIEEENWDLYTAYKHLQNKRFIVKPNESFRLQLAQFEVSCTGYTTVADTKLPDWNFSRYVLPYNIIVLIINFV